MATDYYKYFEHPLDAPGQSEAASGVVTDGVACLEV